MNHADMPQQRAQSLVRKIQAFASDRTRRIVHNVHETRPLFQSMVRKPAIVRVWLLTARQAQIALLAVLLVLPTVVSAGLEFTLEKIFPPRTSAQLFGLMSQTTADPRVDQWHGMLLWGLWIVAAAWVAALLWRHVPSALTHAEERARRFELQADSLLRADPQRSATLYRSAAALVIDPKRGSELEGKAAQAGGHYGEEVDAVKRALGPDTRTRAVSAGGPGGTVLMREPAAKGLPIAAVGPDGRYRLESVLGRGAMGVVYRGRDLRLDRPVALKQLFTRGQGDEEAMHRFRQEARVLARLSHPNIVQVYDFVEEDSGAWIAMELVEGDDLEYVLSNGALDPQDVVRHGSQLADGLGYAHEKGVIHRDFKPANVLIDKANRCKISDFGIAKLGESSVRTQVGTVLGSPAYMSPEQARGTVVDARTDIYALGVTLYHLCTGRVPFRGDTESVLAQVLTQAPPAPRSINPACPAALEALILEMMAKPSGKRPKSMAEVKAALDGIRPG